MLQTVQAEFGSTSWSWSWAAWKRRAAPRVLLSLLTAWLAASYLRPPVYHVLELSKLGQDVRPDNKYGLSPYKLGIIFEPRPVPHLAAHVLHTVAVLPSDWPVLYVGSYASIKSVNSSYGIQQAQLRGRLWLQEAPDWIDFEDEDQLAAIISMPEFYSALPQAVEWLYMAGTDSILCSTSLITMDEWLHYDFVGSPWATNSWHGGSNGVSLRRVSKVKRTLEAAQRDTTIAMRDDTHLMEAIYSHSRAVVPSESTSALFVMEGLWVERPMAYHPSPSFLKDDEGWVKESHRRGIWDHCPELKTIMEMKLSRERCPDPPPTPPAPQSPAAAVSAATGTSTATASPENRPIAPPGSEANAPQAGAAPGKPVEEKKVEEKKIEEKKIEEKKIEGKKGAAHPAGDDVDLSVLKPAGS